MRDWGYKLLRERAGDSVGPHVIRWWEEMLAERPG